MEIPFDAYYRRVDALCSMFINTAILKQKER